MIFDNQGTPITYDDYGSGNVVLFIHGHPFNRSMWAPQTQSLRWKYRTIAPDLRGYGNSSLGTQGINTLETMVGDLVRLLDHLQIAKCCIVGLSMGGQIAMELAGAYPDRITAAVFAATFPQQETPEGIIQRNKMADRLLAEGMALAGSEMLSKLIGPVSLRQSPSIAAQVYGMICSTDHAGAAAALRGRALRRDYTESLKQLRVPCLIVIGTDDAYTTEEEARTMHSLIPNSVLEVFPHIGHMPNLEDEDRFNRHLYELLAIARW